VDIPGYRIEGVLGKGAMGMVYKAVQLSMNRLVAIKVLSEEFAKDKQFTERFLNEARSMGKLRHENIVSAIDAGSADGIYYFVMDYIDGETLDNILKSEGRLDTEEAFEIARQVAEALDYAHSKGIVHRDVKPGNIIIDRNGVAKLCDLGLARPKGGMLSEVERGKAEGTPFYISPEQARGEADIDHRSDIYSLGATLYHLVTGIPPFRGGDVKETMRMHIEEPLVPVRQVIPEVEERFAKVIEKMLQKSREKRYHSARDVADDIETVLRGGEPRLGGRPTVAEFVQNKYFVPSTILAAGFITFILLILTGGENKTEPKKKVEKKHSTPKVSRVERHPPHAEREERKDEEKRKEALISLKEDMDRAIEEATDLADLKVKLEALLVKYAGKGVESIITKEIKRIEEQIAAHKRLKRETEKAHKALEESERLLEEGDYGAAWRTINALQVPQPLAEQKRALLRRIRTTNRDELERLYEEVKMLTDAGEFAKALEAVNDLHRRSIPEFIPTLENLKGATVTLQKEWKEKETYTKFVEEFNANIKAGRFEEARDLARKCLELLSKEDYREGAEKGLFVAEATLRTIARLREAFKEVLGKKVTYKLLNGENVTGEVVAVTDEGVVFKQGGLHRTVPLSELDTTELLRLISGRNGRIFYESGIYLMVTGHPERAFDFFIEAQRLGVKVDSEWMRKTRIASREAREKTARDAFAKLEELLKKNKPDLAATLFGQILTDKALKNTDFVKRNADFFRKKIRQRLVQEMKSEGLKLLLEGRVKQRKDGIVKLEYRFSDKKQFDDWILSREQKSYIRRIEGNTIVKGTIYNKVVFDGDLEVEIRCVALRDNPADIGILLKTTQDGAYLFGLERNLPGKKSINVRNGYVRLPANIIVRYHNDWNECYGLFGYHLPKISTKSYYKVVVSHKGNELKFVVNGKKLAEIKESFPKDSRGLVALSAGDGTFRVTYVCIEGRVDQEWLSQAFEEKVLEKYPYLAEKHNKR